MIAFKITQQKNFMARLLTTDIFDKFLLEEAVIDTFSTFSINGRLHKDFYKGQEESDPIPDQEFVSWEKIRPIALNLIKGKQTPLGFKFILHLGDEEKLRLLSDADMNISPDQIQLGINIRYANGEVVITSGVSYSIFTLDKSAEKAWDEYIPSFLESNDIAVDYP